MNKDSFFGWKSVCSFTYVQTMKSNVMKVVMAILFAIMALSVPLITMLNSEENEKEPSKIKTAYLYSEYEFLDERLELMELEDEVYKEIKLEWIESEQREDILKDLKEDKESADVLVEFIYDGDQKSMDYGLEVKMIYADKGDVKAADAEDFAFELADNLDETVLKGCHVEENLLNNLTKDSVIKIQSVDSEGAITENDAHLDGMEYSVTYIYLVVIMFAIMIAGSKVAELIVTEKTSKVMEYLLTSIKPLALLIGKVISTMLIILSIMLEVVVALGLSLVLNKVINPGEKLIPQALVDVVESGVFREVTPLNILIMIVMVLLGFIFYCLLAGLAGATVGKVEELAEGLKLFSFTMVLGTYLALGLIMFAGTGDAPELFCNIVYYLPLSSVFIVPIYLLLGKITLGTAAVSLVVLVLLTLFMWYFVTKVFEHVLYNSGNVIKFKEIISIYKMTKSEDETEVHDGK